MSRHNTNNPVPSNEVKDFSDNAQIVDEIVHSPQPTTKDRFGNDLKTWRGIQDDASEAISQFGYITMDSFEDGATLTLPNQALRYEATGEYYRWDGQIPVDGKVVPPESTPESTGGIGPGAWIGVGDASLRSSLAAPGGATLVANSAITVRDMSTLKSSPWVKVDQLFDLQSYVSLDHGGRGYWLAVNTSTVTPNGIDIVQSVAKPAVSFVFHPVNGKVDIRQVGAIGGADVTAILNRVHDNPAYRVVFASKLNSDSAFICSATVILKKSFIGIGLPQFDFTLTALDTPSFYTGDTGQTNDVEYSGFEIKNSQHVALRGKGDRVLITRVKCTNSRKQGINWQGTNWKVTWCYVSTVAQEFGILNGGISQDVEIAFNYVEYTAASGGIELGYVASDARVHHNSIRNCYIGIQVYEKTTGASVSAFDITVADNNIKNSTLHSIHVNCGVSGDGFSLVGLYIKNNVIDNSGTTGILVEKGATDVILDGNEIVNVTANIAIQITSFLGYCLIKGGYIARCNQGIYIQQEGVDVEGVRMYNITYDAFLWPTGNAFTSQSVRNCYFRTIGRDFIRNFSYASYPGVKDYNNIKMPLTSFAQMNGATVVAGQVYYIDNAPSGGSPGFYIISSGVVGSGAAARNLAAIANS